MKLRRYAALALCLLPTVGCSSCSKDEKTPANDGGATTTTEAGPSGSTTAPDAAAARAAFCRVKVPTFVVDRGVRAETGVTLAAWSRTVAVQTDAGSLAVGDGGATSPSPDAAADTSGGADAADASAAASETGPRIALGYAKGHGKPFVAELGEDGAARIVPVPSTLTLLEEKPAEGTRRVVQRVVPLSPTAAGAEAAVDYVETGRDKTRRVHCGPASGGPFVSTSGASLVAGAADATSETIECRTIRGPSGPTALESTLTVDGTRMLAELLVGKTKIAARETPMKPSDKANERYAFTLLGHANRGGFSAATARFNGNVVVVTSADGTDTVAQFWLGTATNAPSPTFSASGLVVATTLNGKPEVYVSTAEPTKKNAAKLDAVSKPEPRPMDDGPEGVTERGAPFVEGDAGVLVLVDTVGGKKVARVHPLGAPSPSSPLPYVFAPAEGSLVEAKVIRTGTGQGDLVLATVTLDPKRGGVLEATVLTCGTK